MIVNGQSIFYDRTSISCDYFHIETAEHAVIWTNDTLKESCLDSRKPFDVCRRKYGASFRVANIVGSVECRHVSLHGWF